MVDERTEKEKQYLTEWGFKNRADFAKYIQETIAELALITEYNKILQILEKNVLKWEQDLIKNKKKRLVAQLFKPPKGSELKSADRIAQKIIDSWRKYDQWNVKPRDIRGKEPKKHDPRNFLTTMADVIRFRIICNYLSDVEYIDRKIRGLAKKSGRFEIISRENHIETPFSKRQAGHRAFQYEIKYYGAEPPVLFEVQIMSQLQHAWDQKDHHLIYEYVRIKKDEKIPVHLKNRMTAMSELLYVADATFDSLKEEITKIMEKKKK